MRVCDMAERLRLLERWLEHLQLGGAQAAPRGREQLQLVQHVDDTEAQAERHTAAPDGRTAWHIRHTDFRATAPEVGGVGIPAR